MSTLENAISLAVLAHKGQKDKAGQPYILHPLRMMCRMRTEKEMIAAVLHDVIEDTHYTLDELRKAGYPLDVIEAVDYLTHREDENYEAFIERIKGNALAVRVKLADLEDNMDIRRLNGLQEKDKERLQRYQWAWAKLTVALDGD
jgi:(p)ppGpp synthase/HD superfamily hydrolase